MTGRIGCQTYTWEMLGPRWQGSPDDILDLVSAAGAFRTEPSGTRRRGMSMNALPHARSLTVPGAHFTLRAGGEPCPRPSSR